MNRKATHILLFGSIAAIVLTYNACGEPNNFEKANISVMGNPMISTHSAVDVLSAMCSKLNRCNPGVSMSACRGGIMSTGGFGSQLGLSTTSYGTYGSIVQAEEGDAIVGNGPATNSCDGAIMDLSCSDPSVVAAYNPSAGNPFIDVPAMIPTSSTANCYGVFAPPSLHWSFVDGNAATTTLVNVDSTHTASAPATAILNSKMYETWQEVNVSGVSEVRVKVYGGNDSSPSWTSVDGAGINGINFDGTKSATTRPQLIVMNSKLYAVWSEANSAGANQIHVAVYNGNDLSPRWAFVDGGTAQGLNHNSSQYASWPKTAVLNSKLYVTWEENTSTSTQIYVSVYNGNDASPGWNFVTGSSNGINANMANSANDPNLFVFSSKLYATWDEFNPSRQIRVAVYNGSDASPSWQYVDGGAVGTGLNKDASRQAQFPSMMSFNSKIYLVWEEQNSSSVYQIRARVYNGSDATPAWNFVDGGGPDGLNFNIAQGAYEPRPLVYNSKLFMTWAENNGGPQQIRVASYGGNDASPNWSFVDGGAATGLNKDPSLNAYGAAWTLFNAKPYLTWFESNGSATLIRTAVGH